MNKKAIKDKVTNAKEISRFRNENMVVKTQKQGTSRAQGMVRNASVDLFRRSLGDDHAFGKQNRPQTPVKGIISGMYGSEAGDYYSRMALEKR